MRWERSNRMDTTQNKSCCDSAKLDGGNGNRRGFFAAAMSFLLCAIRKPVVWVPVLLLIGLTLLFRLSNLDLTISRLFYQSNPNATLTFHQWPWTIAKPWIWLYNWGCYPALILGGGGLVVWIVSFFWKRLESWRDPGLFYFAVLIVGPGLMVNVILKPFWERPRPYTITEFGGDREFVPVFQQGNGQHDASFPSGHASMGFFLMTPAFVFFRTRPRLAWAFLGLGIAAGLTIGFARIVAGGHFTSDVLWAGGVDYFCALILAVPFRFGKHATPQQNSSAEAVV
jgi:lipid A 4'-phosphatase